jgi:hypothetical protein
VVVYDGIAWVVNQSSNSVSPVRLTSGRTGRAIRVGSSPINIAIANGPAASF